MPLALDESGPLVDLVVWLGHADIAVGVDTGAMHIAAMGRTRQVVLFTPRHAMQWATDQPNARVLVPPRGPEVIGIGLEEVRGRSTTCSVATLWGESG